MIYRCRQNRDKQIQERGQIDKETIEQKDYFYHQVWTLNSPISKRTSNCTISLNNCKLTKYVKRFALK